MTSGVAEGAAVGGSAERRTWAAATWSVPGFLVVVPALLVLMSFAEGGGLYGWAVYLLPLTLVVAVFGVVRQPPGVLRGVAIGYVAAFAVAVVSWVVVVGTL